MTDQAQRTAEGLKARLNGHGKLEPVEFEVVYGDIGQIRRTRWAWEGWLPLGALVIIAGEPGAGKGVWTSWMLAHLTQGTLPGDLEGEPARVLWVGFEDSWEEVVLPRLAAAGADVNLIGHLRPKTAGEMLELARDHDQLLGIVQREQVRVIVFEALVDHLSGTDDYKNAEVRRALTPLVELARAERVLVAGTTHLNKMSSGTYRQRVAGSGGYLAVARVGLLIHQHPQIPEQRVVALGKGNLGKVPDAIAFEIEGLDVSNLDGTETADAGVLIREYQDSSLTVDELLAGSKPDHGSKEHDAVEFMRSTLADGPMPSTEFIELATDAGFSHKTLRKYRDEAGVETYQQGRAWWWRLKGADGSSDGRVPTPSGLPSEPSEPSDGGSDVSDGSDGRLEGT